MHERPLSITAICIIFVYGIVRQAFILDTLWMLTNNRFHTGALGTYAETLASSGMSRFLPWIFAFGVSVIILQLFCITGLWMMKRWGIYLFTFVFGMYAVASSLQFQPISFAEMIAAAGLLIAIWSHYLIME